MSASLRARSLAAGLAVAASFTGAAMTTITTAPAAHAVVPVADTADYPVLRAGDSGTAVKVLQAALNNAVTDIGVDGAFGPGTTTAVKNFQSSKHLSADGVVGANTWAALLSQVSASSTTTWLTKAVQIGVGTSADGIWGSGTTAAVEAFQESKGLDTDGIVGTDTWGAILGARPTTTVPSAPTTGTVIGPVTSPSDGIACAAGTRDLGTGQAAYIDGKAIKVRLCAVTGLHSTSEESTPGKAYYVSGANGEAIVNSRVSGAFAALFALGKQKGLTLAASSSFRTMQHQRDLCNANAACRAGTYTSVARPGGSPHQSGLAIDFAGISGTGSSRGCTARATSTAPAYLFLKANAPSHGIEQYSAEAWHWDARTDLTNRC